LDTNCIFRQRVKQRYISVKRLKGGLKFKMPLELKFKKDEIIEVEFNLDNSGKTHINKQAFVRNIKGTIVNVEFCSFDPNDSGDKAIAFYLL